MARICRKRLALAVLALVVVIVALPSSSPYVGGAARDPPRR